MTLQIPQFQCLTCNGVYFSHCTDGSIYQHVCGPVQCEHPQQLVPRPDARNENIDTTRTGVITGIVSEGLGVQCLTSRLLQEPTWITRLKANVPTDEDER